MKITEGTILQCGTCWDTFTTWKGYKDQWQDEGYGICPSCQKDAKKQNNDMYDDIFDTIMASVWDKTKEAMQKTIDKYWPKKAKIIIVNWAIDNNLVKWEIW